MRLRTTSTKRKPHGRQAKARARKQDAAGAGRRSGRKQALARTAGAARLDPLGPFAVFLHAPAFGELAQQLGGHCRYKTGVPPRLSEFAILVTAKLWRAQYEWFAHVPQAERAGISKETIRELRQGMQLKTATKEERAIYDFIQELYRSRRVSDRNFKRVKDILGEAAAGVRSDK